MSATKRLTWPQCNALRALRDACDQLQGTAQVPAEYATPAQIARMLWPDSDGWKRASNRGATTAGGAMGATRRTRSRLGVPSTAKTQSQSGG